MRCNCVSCSKAQDGGVGNRPLPANSLFDAQGYQRPRLVILLGQKEEKIERDLKERDV